MEEIELGLAVTVEHPEKRSWEEIAQTQQHYIYRLAYRLCGWCDSAGDYRL